MRTHPCQWFEVRLKIEPSNFSASLLETLLTSASQKICDADYPFAEPKLYKASGKQFESFGEIYLLVSA